MSRDLDLDSEMACLEYSFILHQLHRPFNFT